MAEVFVHEVRAGQELLEIVRPDGQLDREPDGRPHRVPAAHPLHKKQHHRRIRLHMNITTVQVQYCSFYK